MAFISLYRNTINNELRQADVLNPTVFNIVPNDVIKGTKEKLKKLQVGYRNIHMIAIKCFC